MNRLLRILLNTATILSLLLCLATIVLWVRSYWRAENLRFYYNLRLVDARALRASGTRIEHYRGHLSLWQMKQMSPPLSCNLSVTDTSTWERWNQWRYTCETPSQGYEEPTYVYPCPPKAVFGFHWNESKLTGVAQLWLPDCAIAIVFAILPAFRIIMQEMRIRPGQAASSPAG